MKMMDDGRRLERDSSLHREDLQQARPVDRDAGGAGEFQRVLAAKEVSYADEKDNDRNFRGHRLIATAVGAYQADEKKSQPPMGGMMHGMKGMSNG